MPSPFRHDADVAPTINVNLNLILPDRALRLLDAIAADVKTLLKGQATMSKELDDLEQVVSQDLTVDQSAATLIQGLAAQIEANKTDPIRLQKMANDLRASTAALAAAVAANTPADSGGAPSGGSTDTGGTTTGGDTGGGETGGTPTP